MAIVELRGEAAVFPPCPSPSAMPEEVRSFLRGWVAAMKQVPVSHPTIKEMPISFEGFGDALYHATAHDLERFFVRHPADTTGATLSLALSLYAYLHEEEQKMNGEKRTKDQRQLLEDIELAERVEQYMKIKADNSIQSKRCY
ncbi:hypothetical protein MGYG_04774 [Nannizzia gypsea CBS 118893]|uniref:Uncharacterized protein n=1 Tax=Arthroderma gypseum (strain ATCC MYA-4604 / CBS 118893) TaxID=535722 RepID=E4UWR9_ARTGP|nr:hypothetical protein MGYG_04774 [Nannizzia gypsea CBS 118893]EFR01772.1 hypothetical protein MGYG_04774 [Nannizzia gypsea CBS 118893]